GDGADDVLVQARRQGFGFDGGDEAGFVLAAELLADFAIGLGRAFDDAGRNCFGGHGCLRTAYALARRRSMRFAGFRPASFRPAPGSRCGGGASICARVMPRRASITTSLMRFQLARTPQDCSMPQLPAWTLHSVMPSGPSSAITISSRPIASAARASR